MSAGHADLVIDQGEDWTAQIIWTDFYDEPLPLTEPIRMDIKSPYGVVVKTLVTSFTPPPDGILPDISYNTETGMIQLHLDHDVTSSFAPGVYNYDLFGSLLDTNAISGNQIARIIYGSVTVSQRITAAV